MRCDDGLLRICITRSRPEGDSVWLPFALTTASNVCANMEMNVDVTTWAPPRVVQRSPSPPPERKPAGSNTAVAHRPDEGKRRRRCVVETGGVARPAKKESVNRRNGLEMACLFWSKAQQCLSPEAVTRPTGIGGRASIVSDVSAGCANHDGRGPIRQQRPPWTSIQ